MKRLSTIVRLCLPIAVLTPIITASCSHKLEGPKKPTVKEADLTFCGADEQAFVVEGTGLSPMVVKGATDKANIKMPTVCLFQGGAKKGCIPEADVSWVSQKEIRFVVRSNLSWVQPGEYDVIITNPDGTKASGGTITLRVLAEGPLIFWSDPSVVYNGISTQITVYGANLGVTPTTDGGFENVNVSLFIRDPDSFAETAICGEDGTPECELATELHNRVRAVVPSGTAAKTYDLVLKSDNGCATELAGGLRVTDTLNDALLTSIDPSFGWTSESTPVTINGDGFQPVPRVYVNPNNAGPGTVASALSSVAMIDATRLTGVVPSGLPAGTYDVVAVNQDGTVDLIDDGFIVTADPPPVVDIVSPNYLPSSSDPVVTIEGSNFRDPAVTLTCRAPGATTTTEYPVPGVMPGTATAFDVTMPIAANGLANGTVCLVRVTNSDGSYFDYSAVGIQNPSLNLNPWVGPNDNPQMTTPRRAPAVTAGRATRAARFIYAIGGDDGSPGGAMASVESTQIDIFGVPGNWFPQPVSLPNPRTLASVVNVGRYLYLVGGNELTNNMPAATASVLRAQILDPLAAPNIIDVAADRVDTAKGETGGVGSGIWYYRVSAVMADNDESNPGGETLAGDPIAVNLPAPAPGVEERRLNLTLFWSEVPNAKGYRIYRSPTGTENLGGVQLVGTVMGTPAPTNFTDTGMSTTPEVPRPLGATGVWKPLANLSAAREAPGAAAGPDPMDPTKWYLYALGGVGLASTERLDITLDPASAVQTTAAAWVAGADLSAARSELTGYALNHSNAKTVPAGTTYIYAGGGKESTDVNAASIPPGGVLAWTDVDAMSPLRAGYAGVPGSGFLFAFGGSQSGPSATVVHAEIDTLAPPAIVNWNADEQMIIGRYLAGGAIESAFIYVVGGTTNTGVVASMERTVL